VIEEGAFSFFEGCLRGGGEWWGEEGGVMNSTREERTRVSAAHEVEGEVKRGLLQTCSAQEDLSDWEQEAAVERDEGSCANEEHDASN
jgi:hypothetical protein